MKLDLNRVDSLRQVKPVFNLALGLLLLIHAPSPSPAAVMGKAEYSVVEIDTVGNYGGGSSMVLGPDGFPVFSYMKYQAGKYALWVAKCTDPECGGAIVRTKVDSAESAGAPGARFYVGAFSSIALTGAGFPVVSYADVWGLMLKFVQCGDPSCSENNVISTLASMVKLSSYPYATSLQLGPGGLPYILFQVGDGQVSIATCAAASCATGATISYPLKTARSEMPSMLVQDNGRPLLIGSGVNGGGGGLSFARCEDARCQGISSTEVDDRIVPMHSSVKKSVEGFPVIAAFEEASRKLNLIKCLDAYCVDKKLVGLVDSVETFGWSPALGIRQDGKPVVAYKNFERMLKVAYCGNSSCSSGNRYVLIEEKADGLLEPLSLEIGAGGDVYIAFISGNKLKIARLPSASSSVRRNRVPAKVRGTWKSFGGRTLSGRAL